MDPVRPYIGITDFTSISQVERLLRVLDEVPTDRLLHVGVMMSYKTLHGIPSKWTGVFPRKEDVAGIFDFRAYNCLHYADYDVNPALAESLMEAIMWGGPNLDALQLDMIWPDVDAIVQARRVSPHVEVILQIGQNALDDVENDPKQLVRRFASYAPFVERVLLDKSMGRGLGMDAKALLPFAQALAEAYPQLGLGAAGGLGPSTMDLAAPLVEAFPNISLDAQSRLRPSGSALDPIDWDMAENYLREAFRLVGSRASA